MHTQLGRIFKPKSCFKSTLTRHISFVSKTQPYKAHITNNGSVVTLWKVKIRKKIGFFCTKRRLQALRSFSVAPKGCTQCVPKPDMHSMEKIELYLEC